MKKTSNRHADKNCTLMVHLVEQSFSHTLTPHYNYILCTYTYWSKKSVDADEVNKQRKIK